MSRQNMTQDCFTKEVSEHLAQIRADVTKYAPTYALEHDRDIKMLKRLANKYRFTFDLAAPSE